MVVKQPAHECKPGQNDEENGDQNRNFTWIAPAVRHVKTFTEQL